ncbi:MAG: S8 family serine peptidase, partial [Actinomycetota bacterium]|nr:S8 family serine peptidase [Actinomycetota bacterium]
MTRRPTQRLVMSTAVAATAACTALVTLPAYALISQTGSSVTGAASSVEPVVDPGPVLRPARTRHLRRVDGLEPVRVMVQADGDTAAARSAVRGAGMSVQTVLDRVGIVVAVGTPTQVRLLESAGASRVDWADRELETFSNTSHRATRGHDVHEGAIDLDGDGVGDKLQGAGVSVAIVDSGVDGTHPMFDDGEGGSRVRRNIKMVCHDILEGFATGSECGVDNTLVGDTDTTAIGGHGTHVAGIAAGGIVTDSAGRELRGAAPEADVVGISTGAVITILSGTLGMYWVLENHEDPCATQTLPGLPVTCAPVVAVNNSWGSAGGAFSAGSPDAVVQRALVDEGITVVWAAGNDGGDGSSNEVNPPSQDPTPGVLSVANYDDAGAGSRDNDLDSSSSRGLEASVTTYPDLSAPGADITSACRPYLPICATGLDLADPDYNTISGTSMAAPHVAGYVAVLQSLAMERTGAFITPAEMENLLVDTVHQYGASRPYVADTRNTVAKTTTSFDAGHGLVDVAAAASLLSGSPASVTDPLSCPVDARFTDAAGDASGGIGQPTAEPLNVAELDILEGWVTSSPAGDAFTLHVQVESLPETPGGLS